MTEVTKTKSDFPLGILVGALTVFMLCASAFCVYELFTGLRWQRRVFYEQLTVARIEGELKGSNDVRGNMFNELERLRKSK